jgi:hypothetical protein
MKSKYAELRDMPIDQVRDQIADMTGIRVLDENDQAQALLLVGHIRKRTDGHVTVLGFTTNWRCIFGTPDLRCGHDNGAEWIPEGRTFADAICRAALFAIHEIDVWDDV